MESKWKCPKCGNPDFDADRFQATGGGLAKAFDVQNKKFSTVTCTKCQYAEMDKADTSSLMNIFGLFTD